MSGVIAVPLARSARATSPWLLGMTGALALALLAATFVWHVPMMLWDHLDLLPVYEAWHRGALWESDLVRVHHGSHLHATAYGVLVLTTELSGGRPWLDCLVSWSLLLCYAGIVLVSARESIPDGMGMRWWLGIMLFALFPGHLANLQWGWQVAVFLCLVSSALCLHLLTSRTLSWSRNLLALASAVCAISSFSTGFALLPVAVVLICLRRGIALRARGAMVVPWLMLAALLAYVLREKMADAGTAPPDVASIAAYTLNFIGGAVGRYATALAPWVAGLALVSACHLAWRLRRERAALPWLGWILFATLAGGLVAVGRAGPFGADHAFVRRYVSFSSTFWLGWIGLLAVGLNAGVVRWRGIQAWFAGLVAVLAVLNALHLIKQARDTALQASDTATRIREDWPAVDDKVLDQIYFGRADIAKERLDMLHARGFAPFGAAAVPSGSP